MRLIFCIVLCAASAAFPAGAQVVLDMPAPPAGTTTGVSDESALDSSSIEVGIVGYDTYEDEPLYASAGDVALFRYAGFRNFPRVTTIPVFPYGRSFYDFNGPWAFPPIVGFPFFFTNHGFSGFGHFGHHHFHHGFHHFGGFHGRFRFGGDHFRGHVKIGF